VSRALSSFPTLLRLLGALGNATGCEVLLMPFWDPDLTMRDEVHAALVLWAAGQNVTGQVQALTGRAGEGYSRLHRQRRRG
jgi:hypothetical protein